MNFCYRSGHRHVSANGREGRRAPSVSRLRHSSCDVDQHDRCALYDALHLYYCIRETSHSKSFSRQGFFLFVFFNCLFCFVLFVIA